MNRFAALETADSMHIMDHEDRGIQGREIRCPEKISIFLMQQCNDFVVGFKITKNQTSCHANVL